MHNMKKVRNYLYVLLALCCANVLFAKTIPVDDTMYGLRYGTWQFIDLLTASGIMCCVGLFAYARITYSAFAEYLSIAGVVFLVMNYFQVFKF